MIKKLLIILGPIVLIIFIFLLVGLWNLKTSISDQDGQKIVTIETGDNMSSITGKLYEAKVIKSKETFLIYSYLSGQYNKFQPGKFYLNPHDNIKTIVSTLTQKPKDEIKVTIPEGWRVTQIGEKLEELGIASQKEFTLAAKDEEGYLFPDTYYFLKNEKAEDIIKKMKTNFFNKTSDLSINLETLIIASIVEREAKFDEDRPIVAGVFSNRLDSDIKLEADPTIQYALGSWEQISGKDLLIDSPYNTYKHKGLPPSPICNPGLSSLKAAANPAQTDYMYFINTSNGKTYFAKTKSEQEANIDKYLR